MLVCILQVWVLYDVQVMIFCGLVGLLLLLMMIGKFVSLGWWSSLIDVKNWLRFMCRIYCGVVVGIVIDYCLYSFCVRFFYVLFRVCRVWLLVLSWCLIQLMLSSVSRVLVWVFRLLVVGVEVSSICKWVCSIDSVVLWWVCGFWLVFDSSW